MKKQVTYHTIQCKVCGTEAEKPTTVTGYLCAECVIDLWDPADIPKSKKPTGYPPGWKFMKQFVHENGKVYIKGEEHPDLFNTLPPTPIKVKVKDTRSKAQRDSDKQDVLVEINKLLKEVKKETRTTYRRKLEIQIKKLQKQI